MNFLIRELGPSLYYQYVPSNIGFIVPTWTKFWTMPSFTITFSWTSILSIFLWCLHANSKHPSDENDLMGREDKQKLTKLAEELLKDAKLKQRQIHVIRNNHHVFLAYDIGLVIGKIREKYKRMMDIYREAYDRINKRTKLMPPTIRDFKLLHWIISLELVHAMEVDIDKLVHTLETIPKSTLQSRQDPGAMSFSGAPQPPGPGGASLPKPGPPSLRSETFKNVLRTSDNSTVITPKPTFQNEDELKQHYREQYQARSGHDANWTLDEYYGVI